MSRRIGHTELYGYFSKFGKLDKAYVAYDPVRGYHKGFGFVIFEELQDAQKVLTIKCHFIQDVRVLVTKNLLKNEYKLKKEQACVNKLERITNKFDEMDLGKIPAPVQNQSYSEVPRYYQYVADPQCYNLPYRGHPESYPGEGAGYLSYQNLAQGNQAHSDIPYGNVRYPTAPSLANPINNGYANPINSAYPYSNYSGLFMGDSPNNAGLGKDAGKTTASTAYPGEMGGYARGGLVRSNTIDARLMGGFEGTAQPNLLFDLEARGLEDGGGVSSNSFVDFLRIPAHVKIMGSDKVVGQPPLMRRRSSGKRGSICSEGGSGDDLDRQTEIPREGKRRVSAFKYEGQRR